MDPSELLACARYGEIEDIQAFVEQHAAFGDDEIKRLLQQVTDNSGNTPLHMAAANGHADIVRLLIKYIDITPNNSGNTPFHWACMNGCGIHQDAAANNRDGIFLTKHSKAC